MAIYLLKKSYRLKNLEEISFKDLWGGHGIFTTMWIFGKPAKILFFNNHIKNLIKSLKKYGINKNLYKKNRYNHLLRVALNRKIISISLRKRIPPKLNFNLKLINLKRQNPRYKNLKYKKILSYLSKMDNSKSDIGLVSGNKILETGTSNLLFVKNRKVFSPKKNFYVGNTFSYFNSKIKKIIKKDILLKNLKDFDEILLIGSGKGIASVKTITNINWKRKSLNRFKIFSKYYKSAIKSCNLYKF